MSKCRGIPRAISQPDSRHGSFDDLFPSVQPSLGDCRGAASGLWSGSSAEGTAVSRSPAARAGDVHERQDKGSRTEDTPPLAPLEDCQRYNVLRRGAASRARSPLVFISRVHVVEMRRVHGHAPHGSGHRRLRRKRTKQDQASAGDRTELCLGNSHDQGTPLPKKRLSSLA